ncbi:MAG: hypothetical protein KF817_10390 [Phycisphaeraceae bacterium]|nr:hypothetical protein [Phycisphaeraceae bacterium]
MKARAAAALSVSAATMLSGAKVVEQALQETPLDLEWPLPGIAPWLPHDPPVVMA